MVLYEEDIRKNTDKFIEKYCQQDFSRIPRPRITNGEVIERRWKKLVEEYANVNQNKIKNYLCNRSDTQKKYVKYYLTTYWWYVIRHKRLLMDGQICSDENCNVSEELEIHHNDNYKCKGEEIKFMNCLETLCRECHSKRHPDKVNKKKRKRISKKSKRNFPHGKNVIAVKKIEPSELQLFHEKVDNINKNVEIVSDSKKHVITIETLSNDELREAILQDLDTLLAILE